MEVALAIKNITVYKTVGFIKGEKYVMSDGVLRQINRISPMSLKKIRGEFEKIYNPIAINDLKKGDKVFMFRSGGIGDIMFSLPLIRILKESYGVDVAFGTVPRYQCVLKNNPNIVDVVDMPFNVIEMEKRKSHLMFEGVIEDLDKEVAKKFHAVDLFLKKAGVDPEDVLNEDKVPRLYFSKEEEERAKNILNRFIGKDLRKHAKKIGIQVAASSPIRTFPIDVLVEVIQEMLDKGYYVFLFGSEKQKPDMDYISALVNDRKLIDLSGKIDLRISMAIVKHLSLMIAPDSSFIHIAGAVGTPIIGLYGCFPSLVRMRYYRNAIGIDSDVSCSPSMLHGHEPCRKGNPPPCFSVVSAKNVLDAVDHLMGNNSIDLEYPDYNVFSEGNAIKIIGM